MRILTRDNAWIIVGHWLGDERTVYGPAPLFECIAWRARALG